MSSNPQQWIKIMCFFVPIGDYFVELPSPKFFRDQGKIVTTRFAQTPLVTESVRKSFHTTYIKLILFRLILIDVCFGFSDIDMPVLELESGQHYGDSAAFCAAMKWRYHHVTVWIISIITADAVVILLLFIALTLRPWLKSSQILNHINGSMWWDLFNRNSSTHRLNNNIC